ncbi:unnamed protein product [Lota lota]
MALLHVVESLRSKKIPPRNTASCSTQPWVMPGHRDILRRGERANRTHSCYRDVESGEECIASSASKSERTSRSQDDRLGRSRDRKEVLREVSQLEKESDAPVAKLVSSAREAQKIARTTGVEYEWSDSLRRIELAA